MHYFILFYWRIIALQYCGGFYHASTHTHTHIYMYVYSGKLIKNKNKITENTAKHSSTTYRGGMGVEEGASFTS